MNFSEESPFCHILGSNQLQSSKILEKSFHEARISAITDYTGLATKLFTCVFQSITRDFKSPAGLLDSSHVVILHETLNHFFSRCTQPVCSLADAVVVDSCIVQTQLLRSRNIAPSRTPVSLSKGKSRCRLYRRRTNLRIPGNPPENTARFLEKPF